MLNINLNDEAATLAFGAQLAAACCSSPCMLFLQGELGAGKTTLTRGFLRAAGFSGKVKSPTYTLVEPYDINGLQIVHCDLYRLRDPEELIYLGFADYLATPGITLIEWPEKALAQLPPPDLTCYIRALDSGRQLSLTAHGPKGEQIMQELKAKINYAASK
jgi:tRNA threonylcarbamoyladenosine biosynthesis protein TsaE